MWSTFLVFSSKVRCRAESEILVQHLSTCYSELLTILKVIDLYISRCIIDNLMDAIKVSSLTVDIPEVLSRLRIDEKGKKLLKLKNESHVTTETPNH